MLQTTQSCCFFCHTVALVFRLICESTFGFTWKRRLTRFEKSRPKIQWDFGELFHTRTQMPKDNLKLLFVAWPLLHPLLALVCFTLSTPTTLVYKIVLVVDSLFCVIFCLETWAIFTLQLKSPTVSRKIISLTWRKQKCWKMIRAGKKL